MVNNYQKLSKSLVCRIFVIVIPKIWLSWVSFYERVVLYLLVSVQHLLPHTSLQKLVDILSTNTLTSQLAHFLFQILPMPKVMCKLGILECIYWMATGNRGTNTMLDLLPVNCYGLRRYCRGPMQSHLAFGRQIKTLAPIKRNQRSPQIYLA